MSNPLTPINDALTIAEDSFRVARACSVLGVSGPVVGTLFDPPDLSYADYLIEHARPELDDLFVMAMTASFEARLKEFLGSRANITAGPYKAKIEKWLFGQIESAPLYKIGDVFKPPVTKRMIDDVEAIRKYRNWVAHGRMANRRPSKTVVPSLAYNALTSFMASAGLI
jgi:hypothetical protein